MYSFSGTVKVKARRSCGLAGPSGGLGVSLRGCVTSRAGCSSSEFVRKLQCLGFSPDALKLDGADNNELSRACRSDDDRICARRAAVENVLA